VSFSLITHCRKLGDEDDKETFMIKKSEDDDEEDGEG
jgi:hypothetical protein